MISFRIYERRMFYGVLGRDSRPGEKMAPTPFDFFLWPLTTVGV
jgi:hypothetical protein